MDTKGIVTGSGGKKTDARSLLYKLVHFRFFIPIVIILLVAAISVIWLLVQNNGKHREQAYQQQLEEAYQLEEAGQLEEAKEAYRELAAISNSNVNKAVALKAQSLVCVSLDDFKCALEARTESDSLAGATAEGALARGYYAQQLQDTARARQYYQEAVDLTPDNPDSSQQETKDIAEQSLKELE